MSWIKASKKRLGMETMIQAKEARRLMLRRNRRARRKDKSLKRLPRCIRKKRCQSEACPVCRLLFRRNLVRECKELGFDEMQWTRVSFIPDKMLWQPGMLFEVEIKRCNEALRKRLERSGLADLIMIGGLDVSFNTFENGVVGWQGHFYVLIMAPNTPKLRRAFMEAIKPDPSVKEPFQFRSVRPGEFLNCLTYAYKNDFYQRSGYFEKRLKIDGTSRQNAVPQRLRGPQSAELGSWLTGYPVGARLFLRNLRRGRSPLYARFSLHLAEPFRDA
jgi:hypothetical protein